MSVISIAIVNMVGTQQLGKSEINYFKQTRKIEWFKLQTLP